MQVDETKNPPKSNNQGTEYVFCGQDCKQKFDRNPQQYVGQGQQAGQGQKTRQSGGGSGA
jgi:YHS domain-containing protein